MSETTVCQAFRDQARFCRRMDAPRTAMICDALAEVLDGDTRTGARVLGWPGEPLTDALPLRLVGGLNAMAMRTPDSGLAALFGRGEGDAAPVLADALRRHDDALLPWLDGPPQTNEIGRSAALMAGLIVVARRFGHPFDLIEIGSSAGLNLLIDRIAFDLGGTALGPADAPIRLVPDWRGAAPPPAPIAFAAIAGCDAAPIDATDPAAAERLRAYVWAEKAERLARIDTAIAMLRARPVALQHADAAEWVERRLALPQAPRTTRVLVHSVVWQYLGAERQARIAAAIERAGAAASAERPLAWVTMEPNRDLAAHETSVRFWPGGDRPAVIARSHPHGEWIEPVAR
jgi:hypothetical protein